MLSDSRQITQGGVGSIPFSDIAAYMDAFRVYDLDERDRFIRMIKALDRVYIVHTNERLKQDRERRMKSASGRRGRKRAK